MQKEENKLSQQQRDAEYRQLPPTGEQLKQISVITEPEKLKALRDEIQETESVNFKRLENLKEAGFSDSDIDRLKKRLDDEVKNMLSSKCAGKKYPWEVCLLKTNGSGIYAMEAYFEKKFIFAFIGVPWLGKTENGSKMYRFGEENLKTGPFFHNFGEDTGFSWYAKYEVPELKAEIEQEFFFFNNGKFIPYITYKGQKIDSIPLVFRFGIPQSKSISAMLFDQKRGKKWHKMPTEFKTSKNFTDEEGFSIKLNDSSQNTGISINPTGHADSNPVQFVISSENFSFNHHPHKCLKKDNIKKADIVYIYLVNQVSGGTYGPWLRVR